MKRILLLILVCFSTLAFAQEPVVSQNVTVLQNTTAAQCPSSWRGTGAPVDVTADTGVGVVNSDSDASVRSCTNCSFDTSSNSCICKTCYDYFN